MMHQLSLAPVNDAASYSSLMNRDQQYDISCDSWSTSYAEHLSKDESVMINNKVGSRTSAASLSFH